MAVFHTCDSAPTWGRQKVARSKAPASRELNTKIIRAQRHLNLPKANTTQFHHIQHPLNLKTIILSIMASAPTNILGEFAALAAVVALPFTLFFIQNFIAIPKGYDGIRNEQLRNTDRWNFDLRHFEEYKLVDLPRREDGY